MNRIDIFLESPLPRVQDAIAAEAEAQRAVYSIEDSLLPIERRLKALEATAEIAAQDGKNAETRKAMAQGWLEENQEYQALLRDADTLKRDLREQRIALAVATHMRELAFASVKYETARLQAQA